jgi:hypothetical protein
MTFLTGMAEFCNGFLLGLNIHFSRGVFPFLCLTILSYFFLLLYVIPKLNLKLRIIVAIFTLCVYAYGIFTGKKIQKMVDNENV